MIKPYLLNKIAYVYNVLKELNVFNCKTIRQRGKGRTFNIGIMSLKMELVKKRERN